MKLEISTGQQMTLYGADFDFSTEANDRIGIDYSGAKDMTLGVKADSIIDELSRIIEHGCVVSGKQIHEVLERIRERANKDYPIAY